MFTAEYLFVRNKISKATQNIQRGETTTKDVRTLGKEQFKNLSSEEKQIWECVARNHLERQKRMTTIIADIVRKNPAISYHGIASAIDNWCPASTIQRWIVNRKGYKLYAERIVTLLSDAQGGKHLMFARRLRNNWGCGKGKYLLIHYDKK